MSLAKQFKCDDAVLRTVLKHRRDLTSKNRRKRRPKRPPRPTLPTRYQIEYRQYLGDVLKKLWAAINRNLIVRLPTILASATNLHPKLDALDDELEDALDAADLEWSIAFGEDELRSKVSRIAKGVSDLNRKNQQKSVKKVIGVDITFNEPYLEEFLTTFASANVGLIEGLADDVFDKMSQTVFEAFRSGMSAGDLADDLQDKFGFAESRANLIARDQVSKLNAGLDRLRQQELGVSRYIWRGMDDNRERDSHRENNDQIFSWDDPPVETGNPGDDINCRCYAEPILDDVLNETNPEGDESN